MGRFQKFVFVAAVAAMAFFSTAGMLRAEAEENLVVVLDPGHDNSDIGARRVWDGKVYAEETICLQIARYAKTELEKYSGVTVYLTRNTNDVSMNRYDRVSMAAGLKADVLISLHCNSWTSSTVSYSSAYVPEYANTAAYASTARGLANTIVNQLCSDFGIKYGGLMADEGLGIIHYGRQYKMPTMIIEHDFLSNKESCLKLFSTEAQLRSVGVSDATAIARYYGLTKKPVKAGWYQEDGGWVYIRTSGVKATGWLTLGGKQYYLGGDGKRLTGWQKIGSRKYYFHSDGTKATGLLRGKANLYWLGNNGRLKTGWINASNGNIYYASKSGKLYKGFKKYQGKKYYFDPTTGAALKGLQVIQNKYYYFSTRTCAQKTGWVTFGGKSYYLTSAGERVTGWYTYRGRTVYLSHKTGEKVKRKWIKKGQKFYYVDKNGYRVENTTKKIKGIRYKFDANGVCQNRK